MSEETVSEEVLAERKLQVDEKTFLGYLRKRYGNSVFSDYLQERWGASGLQKEPDCGI